MITCFRLAGGAVMPRDTAIAAEIPVALVYNSVPCRHDGNAF
jgi:hypothetical protein